MFMADRLSPGVAFEAKQPLSSLGSISDRHDETALATAVSGVVRLERCYTCCNR